MIKKFGFLLSFALHLLLANLCFPQLALAMTPDVGTPMSKENAQECPWVRMHPDLPLPGGKSPCASGHCITEPAQQTPCFAHPAQETMAATLPVSAPAFEILYDSPETLRPQTADRPPGIRGVTFVVMRE